MTIFLLLKCVILIGFAISDSAVLTRPSDVSSCAGENVTIAWKYDNPADLYIALWTFDNGTLYDILKITTTGTPVVQPSSPLNIEFIENGTIKLINTMSSYTGKYDLSLTYINGNPDSDSVDIIITDVPEPLLFQENVTTHTFTCSGSSSIPTVIRVSTSVGNFRYEASPYTSSVTTEGIECCYNGSAASCSTETFTANYDGTIYCQQVRNASTTVPSTLSTTTQIIPNTTGSTGSTSDDCEICIWCEIFPWWCTIIIVIILIIIVVLCTLGYWRYKRIYLFKKKEIVIPAKENGGNNSGNETSRETKPPRRTIHDDNQGNGQSIRANGPNALPPMTGYSKVKPYDNQLSGDPDKNTPNNEANYTPRPLPILPNIRSSQAPNIDDVETETLKKKKKRKETEKDQIV